MGEKEDYLTWELEILRNTWVFFDIQAKIVISHRCCYFCLGLNCFHLGVLVILKNEFSSV